MKRQEITRTVSLSLSPRTRNLQTKKPMVSSSCNFPIANLKTKISSRDEVYVATLPLRATRGPAQLLMSAAYSLNWWDLQHFIVIIKPPSPTSSQVLVYDFQPQDPENILVAVAALSGRRIPGVVHKRKTMKLPNRRCWFIGYSKADAAEAAEEFNERWETELRIGHHDCRDYANGLVEHITGEKAVLELLKSRSHGK